MIETIPSTSSAAENKFYIRAHDWTTGQREAANHSLELSRSLQEMGACNMYDVCIEERNLKTEDEVTS